MYGWGGQSQWAWPPSWGAVSGSAKKEENQLKHFKQKETGCILNWKLSAYKIFGRDGGVEIRGPFGLKTNHCSYKVEVRKRLGLPPPLSLPLVTCQGPWRLATSVYFCYCLLVHCPIVGKQSPFLFCLWYFWASFSHSNCGENKQMIRRLQSKKRFANC